MKIFNIILLMAVLLGPGGVACEGMENGFPPSENKQTICKTQHWENGILVWESRDNINVHKPTPSSGRGAAESWSFEYTLHSPPSNVLSHDGGW